MTTVQEAGRKGVEKTRDTHDREFFRKMGKKGGKKHAQNLSEQGISPELHEKYSESGRKGGEVTRKTHGKEFYQEIGRKGGSTPRKA